MQKQQLSERVMEPKIAKRNGSNSFVIINDDIENKDVPSNKQSNTKNKRNSTSLPVSISITENNRFAFGNKAELRLELTKDTKIDNSEIRHKLPITPVPLRQTYLQKKQAAGNTVTLKQQKTDVNRDKRACENTFQVNNQIVQMETKVTTKKHPSIKQNKTGSKENLRLSSQNCIIQCEDKKVQTDPEVQNGPNSTILDNEERELLACLKKYNLQPRQIILKIINSKCFTDDFNFDKKKVSDRKDEGQEPPQPPQNVLNTQEELDKEQQQGSITDEGIIAKTTQDPLEQLLELSKNNKQIIMKHLESKNSNTERVEESSQNTDITDTAVKRLKLLFFELCQLLAENDGNEKTRTGIKRIASSLASTSTSLLQPQQKKSKPNSLLQRLQAEKSDTFLKTKPQPLIGSNSNEDYQTSAQILQPEPETQQTQTSYTNIFDSLKHTNDPVRINRRQPGAPNLAQTSDISAQPDYNRTTQRIQPGVSQMGQTSNIVPVSTFVSSKRSEDYVPIKRLLALQTEISPIGQNSQCFDRSNDTERLQPYLSQSDASQISGPLPFSNLPQYRAFENIRAQHSKMICSQASAPFLHAPHSQPQRDPRLNALRNVRLQMNKDEELQQLQTNQHLIGYNQMQQVALTMTQQQENWRRFQYMQQQMPPSYPNTQWSEYQR